MSERPELPESIKYLADAIEKKGAKIAFGLEQQGHIPTIEKMLNEFGSAKSEYIWEKIGKEIGWCPRTASLYYLEYLRNKKTTNMFGYIKKLIKSSVPKFNNELDEATYDENEEVLTMTFKDGTIEKYKGSGTVWHEMPLMKRCGTLKEYDLCDIYKYIKHYGNPYPKAHKKK
jgi:hypothetical protein